MPQNRSSAPSRLGLAIKLLIICALIAVSGPTVAASAQGQLNPDQGTFFLSVYADPEGDGSVPAFVVESPCLSGEITIAAAEGVLPEEGDFQAGRFTTLTFNELVDAAGDFCTYTVTPVLTDPLMRVYPDSVSFEFDNGPFAEGNATFSVLGPDTTGAVRVGSSAWPISIDQWESGTWPSSSTWTYEGFPESWVYEVTSPCLDAPQQVELEATGEAPGSYATEGVLRGLPLFAADGSECEYLTEPILPPGFVVARRVGRLAEHSLLPQLVTGPSFLIVRTEVSLLCRGHVVTVDLATGEVPTEADDVIMGTDGDDAIFGGGGDDIICGGGGDDLIRGQAGNDTIYGDDGDDFIRGAAGNDTLFAGDGRDDVSGGPGDDHVWGQGGDDHAVRGGTGFDYVNGGEGNDTLVAGNGGEDVVDGSSGDDKVTGGPRPDEVRGGDGDDEVKGNSGADQLSGGPGDDELFGGPQPDSLNGGGGVDFCSGGTQVDTSVGCESTVALP